MKYWVLFISLFRMMRLYQRSQSVNLKENNVLKPRSRKSNLNIPKMIHNISNSYKKSYDDWDERLEDYSINSISSEFDSSFNDSRILRKTGDLIKKLLNRDHNIFKKNQSHKKNLLQKPFENGKNYWNWIILKFKAKTKNTKLNQNVNYHSLINLGRLLYEILEE